MALSDNEKAATFIGWEPGQKCVHEFVYLANDEQVCSICDLELRPWDRGLPDERDRPCPDMSEPNNYMRALETVTKRHWYPYIEADEHFDGITWRVFCGHNSYDATEDVTDSHLSGAIIKTLANIYDAEHGG